MCIVYVVLVNAELNWHFGTSTSVVAFILQFCFHFPGPSFTGQDNILEEALGRWGCV